LQKMTGLVEDIYMKNKDKLSGKEDVFRLFATWFFNGDIKSVAKLIEDTYGKGFFREIGEKTSRPIKNEIESK
jgi:hypothetical protein